jgi:hypothetical protein
VTGYPGIYWGVGFANEHSCKGCCFTCGVDDPVTILIPDMGDDKK